MEGLWELPVQNTKEERTAHWDAKIYEGERLACRKRKLETKQAEYSKDSHTPRIIMKFPRLPRAQVGLLNNLESSSPSCNKQVGVGGFANASSLLLSLSPRGRSGCPESFPLGIQMEKQARWACHLHKATECDDGSSEIVGLTSSSEPHRQNQGPSGASRGRGWGWGVQVNVGRWEEAATQTALGSFGEFWHEDLISGCLLFSWCVVWGTSMTCWLHCYPPVQGHSSPHLGLQLVFPAFTFSSQPTPCTLLLETSSRNIVSTMPLRR